MRSVHVVTSLFAISNAMVAVAANAQTVLVTRSNEAQDAGSVNDGGGEIIVTAQRKAENIRNVPLSIQAFSGEGLAKAGVTDTTGLAQVTTGLNYSLSTSSTPVYTLRGLGFNATATSVTSPVGTYVDEVAYPYPAMMAGPLFDIDRIEVLKGPQGTLYGRNTTGGLINFVPHKPGRQLEAGAQLELGNFKTHNFEGFLSGPVTETVRFRIAGRWEKSNEGWQHSRSRPEDRLGRKDKLALRGYAIIEPSDKLTFELGMNFWQDKSDTTAFQATSLVPDQVAFLNPGVASSVRSDWRAGEADWDAAAGGSNPLRADNKFHGVNLRMKADLSDQLTLISLSAYNHLTWRNLTDADGTPFQLWTTGNETRIKSYSQELRLIQFWNRASLTIGGYFAKDAVSERLQFFINDASLTGFLRFLAGAADPANTRYTAQQKATGFATGYIDSKQDTQVLSAFANGEVEFDDHFKVTGGVRYTSDRLKPSVCSRDAGGNTVPVWNTALPLAILLQSGIKAYSNFGTNECITYKSDYSGPASYRRPDLNEDNLAFRMALNFQANKDALIYASVSRGYKSGLVGFIASNVEDQEVSVRQEKVTTFELGTKLRVDDGLADINAAFFYSDYVGKQLYADIPDRVFGTLARLVNIPKSRVVGAELELSLRPAQGLNFNLGTSYTNAKITRYSGFDANGSPVNMSGAQFNFSPEWQITGGMEYERPINSKLTGAVSLNANYRSATNSRLDGLKEFQIRPYTLVNANVAIYSAGGHWRYAIFARNLTNANYWTSTANPTDTVSRAPGMSRTYGASVTWRY